MFCLPKEFADKFISSVKDGTIQPEKLAEMTSAERRTFFEGIVGKDDASSVNALFESKLLLKDYKRGLVTWAKQISGISDIIRKDLLDRIENLDAVLSAAEEKTFLADLAAQKLGVKVSLKEAETISAMSKEIVKRRESWDPVKASANKDPLNRDAGWRSTEDRLKYGEAVVNLRDYMGELQQGASKFSIKEAIQHPIKALKAGVYGTFGFTKSLLSSLDNSFYGRQGIKVLYTHPSVWAKGWLKSWGDIGKSLVGKDVLKAIQADVYSRPNAMNGAYKMMSLDVGIKFEEAFPTVLQESIPGIGRFFKAADVAFTGGALRMRADLADMLIPKAEEFGLSMKTGADARGVGRLVNSMTGRGYIGGASGTTVNALFFSVKFLKSNIDTLTGHAFWQGDLSPQAKIFMQKQAATNLLKIAATTAFILSTVKALNPDATSLDPRNSKFGKIKVGPTTIDLTGGMGSMVSLASRLSPTLHNGKWGFWTINTKGVYTELTGGKYGQNNAFDVLLQFMAGKFSPIAAAFRDVWKGENYRGERPTILNTATGVVTPLPIQTYLELKKNESAPLLLGMIADVLGFSTYTPPTKK